MSYLEDYIQARQQARQHMEAQGQLPVEDQVQNQQPMMDFYTATRNRQLPGAVL